MMRNVKPISALLVGTVSAAIYGGVTLLCGPLVLFFFTAGSPHVFDPDPRDGWATLAVFVPLGSAALGFVSGLFMASMFNFFVRHVFEVRPAVVAIRPASRRTYSEESDISGVSSRSGNLARSEQRIIAG